VICAGCQRQLEAGDEYIVDTASGFCGADADPVIDGLIADIFARDDTLSGGGNGDVIFCEACTDPTREGRWHLQTYVEGE
jgi:NMD protein affecting ribosome stability and mRNA decay